MVNPFHKIFALDIENKDQTKPFIANKKTTRALITQTESNQLYTHFKQTRLSRSGQTQKQKKCIMAAEVASIVLQA